MPAPVLTPGQRRLRNDSMTWSVATPTWVVPRWIIPRTDASTPRTAATSLPVAIARGGKGVIVPEQFVGAVDEIHVHWGLQHQSISARAS